MKAKTTGSVDIQGFVPVKSSFIRGVQYVAPESSLIIFFDKSAYRYRNVKRVTATRLAKALSPGRFFHRNIRGKYAAERIA
jgi:hypothetical protein